MLAEGLVPLFNDKRQLTLLLPVILKQFSNTRAKLLGRYPMKNHLKRKA